MNLLIQTHNVNSIIYISKETPTSVGRNVTHFTAETYVCMYYVYMYVCASVSILKRHERTQRDSRQTSHLVQIVVTDFIEYLDTLSQKRSKFIELTNPREPLFSLPSPLALDEWRWTVPFFVAGSVDRTPGCAPSPHPPSRTTVLVRDRWIGQFSKMFDYTNPSTQSAVNRLWRETTARRSHRDHIEWVRARSQMKSTAFPRMGLHICYFSRVSSNTRWWITYKKIT